MLKTVSGIIKVSLKILINQFSQSYAFDFDKLKPQSLIRRAVIRLQGHL